MSSMLCNIFIWEISNCIMSCSQPSSSHSTFFFIGFRSGLWLGYSKILMMFWSNSVVDMDFGSWIRWIIIVLLGSSSSSPFLPVACTVSAKIVRILELSMIPSMITGAPVSAEEKQPRRTMLPPPCFTAGMVFFRYKLTHFLLQICLLALCPNIMYSVLCIQIMYYYVLCILGMPC